MEPFWADAAHSCDGCGAQDVGLHPENCKCRQTPSKPLPYKALTKDQIISGWFALLTFFALSATATDSELRHNKVFHEFISEKMPVAYSTLSQSPPTTTASKVLALAPDAHRISEIREEMRHSISILPDDSEFWQVMHRIADKAAAFTPEELKWMVRGE